ncbi:MAG: hypothetical protein IKO41_01595, partial [Lachnospiraceae bacterium]|nr:hypothetical protein [Lachnospiraceae bacterium]
MAMITNVLAIIISRGVICGKVRKFLLLRALFAKSVDFHKNTLCLWALDNFPAKYDCMGNQAPLLHRINTFRKKSL